MGKQILKKASVFFAAVMLLACNNNKVYDQYMSMPQQGWYADSLATFNVEIEDTAAMYAVYLKLRHNQNYPYRNIWFFRTVRSNNGIEYTDTINYLLADAMGKWNGSGIGELKNVVMNFKKEALKFNHSGAYSFEIQQGMQDTILPGITEIGLELILHNTTE